MKNFFHFFPKFFTGKTAASKTAARRILRATLASANFYKWRVHGDSFRNPWSVISAGVAPEGNQIPYGINFRSSTTSGRQEYTIIQDFACLGQILERTDIRAAFVSTHRL